MSSIWSFLTCLFMPSIILVICLNCICTQIVCAFFDHLPIISAIVSQWFIQEFTKNSESRLLTTGFSLLDLLTWLTLLFALTMCLRTYIAPKKKNPQHADTIGWHSRRNRMGQLNSYHMLYCNPKINIDVGAAKYITLYVITIQVILFYIYTITLSKVCTPKQIPIW